jgi:hypothetical protein
MKRHLMLYGVWAALSLNGNAVFGQALVLNVPDWNQPSAYGVGGYLNWCSPTAGGNVMGYWEDMQLKTGLADRQTEPLGPAYPSNPGTWRQGLFNDGMVEMGWFMDTGDWQTGAKPFPPNAGSTNVNNIAPGVTGYATSSWLDLGGLSKVPYSATVTTDAFQFNLATMWQTYMGEINASRPALVTFDTWVNSQQPTGQTWTVSGQNIVEYAWGSTEPHTVVGVGWIDPTVGAPASGDEFFITQDGWQTTVQYVAVPLIDVVIGGGVPPFGPTVWRQNDYISIGDRILLAIPEPSTLTLCFVGLLSLIPFRLRHRVRG